LECGKVWLYTLGRNDLARLPLDNNYEGVSLRITLLEEEVDPSYHSAMRWPWAGASIYSDTRDAHLKLRKVIECGRA
jgi:hypothetical protein